MAILDERTIAMVKAIYARRQHYTFIDKSLTPDDEYYEFELSAESLLEAWDVLDWDRDRYEYIDGPENEEDYEGLI